MTEPFADEKKFLRTVLDTIPCFVNSGLKIVDVNRAALRMTVKESDLILRRLCGDVLKCIHARESIGGCGTTEYCPDCAPLRQFDGDKQVH